MSVCHRLSSKSSKCPRRQAETEPCRIQWSGFLTFLCRRWIAEGRIRGRNPAADCGEHRESIADIPVPQVVEELVEVFKLQIVEKIDEKTVEVPQAQFIDKAVDIPVVAQKQAHLSRNVQETIEVPQVHVVVEKERRKRKVRRKRKIKSSRLMRTCRLDSGGKKQEAEEEGGSGLRQGVRNENGVEGGVTKRQSPEDPECREWK